MMMKILSSVILIYFLLPIANLSWAKDSCPKKTQCLQNKKASGFNNRLIRTGKAGKYGFIDNDGKVVIPLKYEDVFSTFHEDLLAVKQNGQWRLLNYLDKSITTDTFDNIWPFHDGLALVQKQGKRGFINTLGKIAIPIEFDDAMPFKDGQIQVLKKGLWGSIDGSGKTVIPIEYDFISPLYNGMAKIEKNNRFGLANLKTGKFSLPVDYDDISFFHKTYRHIHSHQKQQSWVALKKDGHVGLFDLGRDKLLLPAKYKEFSAPDKRSLSGYIFIINDVDDNKNFVSFNDFNNFKGALSSVSFDYVWRFNEGVAMVKKGKKRGFINTTGEIIIPIEFDDALSFKGGQALVQKNGRWGNVDNQGNMIIPIEYNSIKPLYGNMAKIEKDDKFGLINLKTGKLAQQIEYDDIDFFHEVYRNILSRRKKDSWLILTMGRDIGLYNIESNKLVLPVEYNKKIYTDVKPDVLIFTNKRNREIYIDFHTGEEIDVNFRTGEVTPKRKNNN